MNRGLTGGRTLSEPEKIAIQNAMSRQSQCPSNTGMHRVLTEDGEGGLVALGMIFGVVWSATIAGLLLLFGIIRFGCQPSPSHTSKKQVFYD